LSAEVIWLCCRQPKGDIGLAIDPRTAIDVAVRDLREIQAHWGTELARERLLECQEMLLSVLEAS
jgi:hypothetical protein